MVDVAACTVQHTGDLLHRVAKSIPSDARRSIVRDSSFPLSLSLSLSETKNEISLNESTCECVRLSMIGESELGLVLGDLVYFSLN